MTAMVRGHLVLLVTGVLILAGSVISPPSAVADPAGVHLVLPDEGITVNIAASAPTTVRVAVPTSIPGPSVTPVRAPGSTITVPPQDTASSPAPAAAPTTPAPTRENVAVRPAPSPDPVGESVSRLPWKSGVFGNQTEHVVGYQDQTGRPVDIIGVFPERDSWDTIFQDWWLDTAPEGFEGTLDVAVPLWPENGNLTAAAAGTYDEEWVRLGRMIDQRYPGSSVRIGWEMNLAGWPHTANEAGTGEWITAFQRASASLRQGGPSLKVVWGPNAGISDGLADPTRVWPGDDFVDIVGLSDYDWWPAITTAETAEDVFSGRYELKWWIAFARAHGKQFALNEWGPAPGNPNGAGDNPVYVEQIMKVLRETEAADPGRIHAVVYFDEDAAFMSNSIAFGQVPRVAAQMRTQMHQAEAEFGNR